MPNKCTTTKLIEAILLLNSLYGNLGEVTAIQFEDGSGNNFNYQMNGSEWKFINISTMRTLINAQERI